MESGCGERLGVEEGFGNREWENRGSVNEAKHLHTNTTKCYWKKLKKIQINRKTFCVHGLENLT